MCLEELYHIGQGTNPVLVSIPDKFDLVAAWLNLLICRILAEFLSIKISGWLTGWYFSKRAWARRVDLGCGSACVLCGPCTGGLGALSWSQLSLSPSCLPTHG